MTAHVHDWKPLTGWVGRYRCRDCGVLAHRATHDGAAKAAAGGRPFEAFRPYVCTVKGCTRGAVRRNPKQVCAEHSP